MCKKILAKKKKHETKIHLTKPHTKKGSQTSFTPSSEPESQMASDTRLITAESEEFGQLSEVAQV